MSDRKHWASGIAGKAHEWGGAETRAMGIVINAASGRR